MPAKPAPHTSAKGLWDLAVMIASRWLYLSDYHLATSRARLVQTAELGFGACLGHLSQQTPGFPLLVSEEMEQ